MNQKIAILVATLALVFSNNSAFAKGGDDHEHEKKPKAKQVDGKKKNPKQKAHEHKEGEKHDDESEDHKDGEPGHDHKKEGASNEHGDSHGEEAEAKNVGPEKGITSFDEDAGFKMSAEALKTFSVEKTVLNGTGPWTVPSSSLLITNEDKSVYRVRNETFKRIDVTVLSKNKTQAVIQSDELTTGDSLVTKGVGDIRVAEVDVTSGESGHSH
ncbi:MAG: hypothetical protein JNM39_17325 [Bdellovibrionaceae bacterium]|nr:hypothetical protein [Pseudobdellovibrionaceae bacterium]